MHLYRLASLRCVQGLSTSAVKHWLSRSSCTRQEGGCMHTIKLYHKREYLEAFQLEHYALAMVDKLRAILSLASTTVLCTALSQHALDTVFCVLAGVVIRPALLKSSLDGFL